MDCLTPSWTFSARRNGHLNKAWKPVVPHKPRVHFHALISAGHLGCRHSGIAFTSERLLLAGAIPRVPCVDPRLTLRKLSFSEPSATIVWKVLRKLDIEQDTVLWNALQMHPHKPGNVRSNRTPTDKELALGTPAMRILVEAFPHAKLIAVGRKAELLLGQMGIATAGQVRHPANGGATAFAEGLALLAGAA